MIKLALISEGVNTWPVYVAQSLGFWRDAGVEVNLTVTGSSILQIEQLKSGGFDIGFQQVDHIVRGVELGADLFIFMGQSQAPELSLMVSRDIDTIADLKGKKIRVFNPSLADFVGGLGATSVTIPFVEMIPAMQRGVADCAITGTLNGNTARLPEVTTHLYPMQAGWSVLFWAVNAHAWQALNPAVRSFLDGQFKDLESTIWGLGAEVDQDGISCSTGGACKRGRPYKMTLVPVTAEAMTEHGRILRNSVVANWAKRCGRACAEEWNQTVGKVVGIVAPTNF